MDKRLRLDKKRTLNVIFRGRAAAESESRVESRVESGRNKLKICLSSFFFCFAESMYI